jgi:hypothetical protein
VTKELAVASSDNYHIANVKKINMFSYSVIDDFDRLISTQS